MPPPVVFTNQKINFHRKRFERESQVQRRDKEPCRTPQLKCKLLGGEKEIEKWMGRRRRRRSGKNEVSIRYLTRRKAFYICYDQTPCVGEQLFSAPPPLFNSRSVLSQHVQTLAPKRCFTAGKHFSIIISRGCCISGGFGLGLPKQLKKNTALWSLLPEDRIQCDSNKKMRDKNILTMLSFSALLCNESRNYSYSFILGVWNLYF